VSEKLGVGGGATYLLATHRKSLPSLEMIARKRMRRRKRRSYLRK